MSTSWAASSTSFTRTRSLAEVKLIAEPWDVGEGGYQVGNFPVLWAEWNGKYRDTVRRFWKGDGGQLSDFAYRLTGIERSVPARRAPAVREHQLHHRARRLHAVRPGELQRQAQRGQRREQPGRRQRQQLLELGAEGPTDDPEINELRERQKRNFLATLLLSPGRADDLRRRRVRPHAARQQQRLLPGQRAHLVRLEAGRLARAADGVHAQAGEAAADASQPAPQKVLPGPYDSQLRGARHRLVRRRMATRCRRRPGRRSGRGRWG